MPPAPPPALRCFALVPCAGSGTRAGAPVPKQYVEIDGAPMVAHTLAALAAVARIKLILVALAPGDEEFERRVDLPGGKRFKVARCGGASRAETVAAGLAQLVKIGARADDWVLVHDAARCLVRPEWIDRLIDVCADDPVGGLLAMPVADTLKRESTGRVMATLPRDGIWQAQTPQMFRLGPLADALDNAGANATDEASAIEWQGLSPRLVPGSSENFKITQPDDFALAEAVLRARRKELA
ncbi:MAG: 2-C-methyl-D-erythritol 4-phosphate cytidylyltransferase [Burkholderiales bacterium]|nr:2-C-methyl-D-erythritol 4-phosphate cytidylyltransferase [Burkholderiales bacterium]